MILWKDLSVLVVDDEPFIRQMMEDEFKELGASVLQASCGNEAQELLKVHKFDVVLSDVRMPNGDGVSLMRFINACIQPKPVLFLFTGFSEHTKQDLDKLNISAVFPKPFDWQAMNAAIEAALIAKQNV